MAPFRNKVIEIVKMIPSGKAVSYGQVALYIGFPRAARQVGWILRQSGLEKEIPWWRVVNQKGKISIDGNIHADRDLQKKLLEADGVEVTDYQVDMGKYSFIPSPSQLKLGLNENYIKKINNSV